MHHGPANMINTSQNMHVGFLNDLGPLLPMDALQSNIRPLYGRTHRILHCDSSGDGHSYNSVETTGSGCRGGCARAGTISALFLCPHQTIMMFRRGRLLPRRDVHQALFTRLMMMLLVEYFRFRRLTTVTSPTRNSNRNFNPNLIKQISYSFMCCADVRGWNDSAFRKHLRYGKITARTCDPDVKESGVTEGDLHTI